MQSFLSFLSRWATTILRQIISETALTETGALTRISNLKKSFVPISKRLFVLEPEYVSASRVHVQVVDSITGAPLSNAIVEFDVADIDGLSSIDGLGI